MEALSQITGKETPEVTIPTYILFAPMLLQNPLIRAAKPESHRYGPLPSQELDVYYPSATSSTTTSPPPGVTTPKPPIFIFIYGGGYTWGRKQMSLSPSVSATLKKTHPELAPLLNQTPSPLDTLYHQNIGSYFSSPSHHHGGGGGGFVTAIPDYRLIDTSQPEGAPAPETEARFPSGATDLLLTLRWIATHLSDVADTSRIYMMGHSAGANHLASLLLLKTHLLAAENADLLRRVRRVVLLSGTYWHVYSREERRRAWERYHGGAEGVVREAPMGLLRDLGQGEVERLPEVLVLRAERDHEGVVVPMGGFWEEWVKRGGRGRSEVLRGRAHNHMSTINGVGCGDEEVEAWAEDVVEWCLRG